MESASPITNLSGPEAPEAPEVTVPPLRRNLRFQALWFGSTASTLGIAVADVAYPLAILALTGSPAWAGLFAAIQTVGMLVAGLPAGAFADRYSGRVVIVVAELARAAITALVVVGLIGHWLSLPLLLIAAVMLGAAQSMAGAARMLLLRAIVPSSQLTSALTQDEVRMQGVAVAGPALGGALYGLRALSHAIPFVFAAAAFAVSAVIVAPLRGTAAEPSGSAKAPQEGGMFAGLRFLLASPSIRAVITLFTIVNTLGAGLELVVIVLLRDQGVKPGAIGLVLGIGAAGALAGVPLVRPLHRLRPGVLMAVTSFVFAPVFLLLAVPLGPWWAGGLLFVGTLAIPAVRVAADILVIRQAPPEQRGRVVAALMTLLGLGIPVGMACSGLLLRYLSAQGAMLTLALILTAGVAWCATRRELWQARWP